MAQAAIKVTGLQSYVKPLKGKVFKDVNRELRVVSKKIAADILPIVEQATRSSQAPQAAAMSRTVRVHSDRVPVVVIGKVNPRFARPFRRPGQSAAESKRRRGALAHGVVYGPRGGRRDTSAAENYYRIPRDDSGGPVGRSVTSSGAAMDQARESYLREYVRVLRHYGFDVRGVR
jgi:hypothetical protein